jgi:hypothetical protein
MTVVIVLLLLLEAGVSCYLPARRAAGVSALVVALGSEWGHDWHRVLI